MRLAIISTSSFALCALLVSATPNLKALADATALLPNEQAFAVALVQDNVDDNQWQEEVTAQDSDPSFDPAERTPSILQKRRGGGGRAGGGGGGGGGSKGSSGRSGGGRSSASPQTSSSSNTGGRTTTGSGSPKAFAQSYSGGASVPYTAGRRSASGISPAFLGAGALAFFPGVWLYSIYAYPYHQPGYFRNSSGENDTLPILCLCQQYGVCGCDENHGEMYTQAIYDNATNFDGNDDKPYFSKIAEVNGTKTLVINGTLANGTTADGGSDPPSGAVVAVGRNWGLMAMALIAGCAAYM